MKRRWLQAATGGFVLCVLLSLCGLYGTCEEVRSSVVRLHILAHSDNEEDQALKLQVRDAVVEAAAGWLDSATDAEEALVLAEASLPRLEEVAAQTVASAGYNYPVAVELCRMYFTTRQYDTVTLPAGMYDAVRITIGAGAGRNWWCVVYPPLCAGAAADRRTMADVLGAGGQTLVEGGDRYVVKFKVIEWFERLFSFFR
ncbi:MAG: stage II sporulation protein R [Clostridia bacterium]|nr:stage II sporulation protein R [Clostridia bacterium]